MAKGTLKINGTKELVGKLKRNANLSDVKNVVIINGAEMQKQAQRLAPVDTGYLRRNITLRIMDRGFTARVKSEAEYAPYQEYGTRYQPGKPHIRPAYIKQKKRFVRDMRRLMK